jgi:hypothetical protein
MWLQKPAAAAQRKGPYTTICGFRNPAPAAQVQGKGPYTTICGFRKPAPAAGLQRQHRGRDHTRPYMASETPRQQHWKSDRKHTYNRPYMLIFVQPAARRGAKIWGGVGRGKKQGKHLPRAPMCVDRYLRIIPTAAFHPQQPFFSSSLSSPAALLLQQPVSFQRHLAFALPRLL